MDRREFLYRAGLGLAGAGLVPNYACQRSRTGKPLHIELNGDLLSEAKIFLETAIDNALRYEEIRQSPWTLGHILLTRGDFSVDGESAVDRMVRISGTEVEVNGIRYPTFKGLNPWTAKEKANKDGERSDEAANWVHQGHIDQFLMMFAEADESLRRLFAINGREYTIEDMLHASRVAIDLENFDPDAGWTLHAYGIYGNPEETWVTLSGDRTSAKDLWHRVSMAYRDAVTGVTRPRTAACFDAHRVNGLIIAGYSPYSPPDLRKATEETVQLFMNDSIFRHVIWANYQEASIGRRSPGIWGSKERLNQEGHVVEVIGNILQYGVPFTDKQRPFLHAFLNLFAEQLLTRDPLEGPGNFRQEVGEAYGRESDVTADRISYPHLMGIYSHALRGLQKIEASGYRG